MYYIDIVGGFGSEGVVICMACASTASSLGPLLISYNINVPYHHHSMYICRRYSALCLGITITILLTLGLSSLPTSFSPMIQMPQLFSCFGYLCSFAQQASSRGRLFSTYWIFFPLGSAPLGCPFLFTPQFHQVLYYSAIM